jgi:hypothetical protein
MRSSKNSVTSTIKVEVNGKRVSSNINDINTRDLHVHVTIKWISSKISTLKSTCHQPLMGWNMDPVNKIQPLVISESIQKFDVKLMCMFLFQF